MVVRQKVGRRRYIAFEIVGSAGDFTRGRLAKLIDNKAATQGDQCHFDVILVSKGRGIVRTDHRHQRAAVALLNSFSLDSDGLAVETLCASGTIRTLKEKYFRQGAP